MTEVWRIATADLSGETLGYMAVSQAWNQCAEINEIMISQANRGVGLGRALMDEGVSWARENGLAVVRLETQTSNVSACLFYERYGFKPGMIDTYTMRSRRQSIHKLRCSGIYTCTDA